MGFLQRRGAVQWLGGGLRPWQGGQQACTGKGWKVQTCFRDPCPLLELTNVKPILKRFKGRNLHEFRQRATETTQYLSSHCSPRGPGPRHDRQTDLGWDAGCILTHCHELWMEFSSMFPCVPHLPKASVGSSALGGTCCREDK